MSLDDINFDQAGPHDEIKGKNFVIRALSYLIDSIAIVILNTITITITNQIYFHILGAVSKITTRSFRFHDPNTLLVNLIFSILLNTLYFTVYEASFSGTFGKVLFRMRVVDTAGNHCNLRQAFIRAIYRLIDGLFFGLVALNEMKAPLYQRLGDKKAQTIVVSSRDPLIKGSKPLLAFNIATLLFIVINIIAGILRSLLFTRIS